jgi:hypothetical protein
MSFPFASRTTVVQTNDHAQLCRFKNKLHEHFTRLYPTRYKPLCPPVYGAFFETNCMELPGLQRQDGVNGLLVYLPQDYSSFVATMVEQCPQVLIHPDIGLSRQRAYFSWAEQRSDSALPQTLWVPAFAVHSALQANEDFLGRRALPLVFAAGDTVAVGELVQSESMCQLAQTALDSAKCPPEGYSVEALKKAQEKALRYSECPWFLMRYELKNGDRRLAVNLAALCNMNPPL